MACFTITFVEEQTFEAVFENLDGSFDASFGEVQRIGDIPIYEGSHIVIPQVTAQTLPTGDMHVLRDITVEQIPSYQVGNPFGGTTYIIGG